MSIIPAIDENGKLFPIEKLVAHEKAQLHLAVSVFIFSGDVMLLQKRADHKYHCPGKWANACCTHPHWDEPVQTAAHRRLNEELGIELSLSEIMTIDYKADVGQGLTEYERVTLFRAHVPDQHLDFNLNPEEVSETAWISLEDLSQSIRISPEDYTPWLKIYCDRFDDLRDLRALLA